MKQTHRNLKDLFSHYMDRLLFKIYKKILSRQNQTSISDDNSYPVVCYMASKSEYFFKKFRRNAAYNDILEHVSQKQGQEYLAVIHKNSKLKFTDSDWDNFHKNDLYGNPVMFSYDLNGRKMDMSPTTLRYAKVLQDIVTLFDARQFKSVAEIGIGYAGQCRLLISYLDNIQSYSLFDLPEVLGLARRYLGKFGKNTLDRIRFIDGTHVNAEGDYDFVISNYAFSELVRDIQDIYLNRVILRSRAGYITWNTLSYEELNGYSLEELLEKIPGSRVIAEEPLTKENNCIIVWGH